LYLVSQLSFFCYIISMPGRQSNERLHCSEFISHTPRGKKR
jgi:hypothetical protein